MQSLSGACTYCMLGHVFDYCFNCATFMYSVFFVLSQKPTPEFKCPCALPPLPPFIIFRILWPVSSSPLSSPPLGSLPLSSPPVSSQHFSAYPFSEFVNVPVNYPHRIDPQVYTEWYTSFHISNNCIHISKHWTHTKDSVFGASRDNLATHIQSVAVVSGCCCLRMCQSCCDSAYVSCISRASDKSKSN